MPTCSGIKFYKTLITAAYCSQGEGELKRAISYAIYVMLAVTLTWWHYCSQLTTTERPIYLSFPLLIMKSSFLDYSYVDSKYGKISAAMPHPFGRERCFSALPLFWLLLGSISVLISIYFRFWQCLRLNLARSRWLHCDYRLDNYNSTSKRGPTRSSRKRSSCACGMALMGFRRLESWFNGNIMTDLRQEVRILVSNFAMSDYWEAAFRAWKSMLHREVGTTCTCSGSVGWGPAIMQGKGIPEGAFMKSETELIYRECGEPARSHLFQKSRDRSSCSAAS